MCIYPMKINPNLIQSRISMSSSTTKGVKGFKYWDLIKKNILINKDDVFDDKLMLKQIVVHMCQRLKE